MLPAAVGVKGAHRLTWVVADDASGRAVSLWAHSSGDQRTWYRLTPGSAGETHTGRTVWASAPARTRAFHTGDDGKEHVTVVGVAQDCARDPKSHERLAKPCYCLLTKNKVGG